MKWNIVADSSCDIFTLKDIAPDTGFTTIPFEITIGEKNFVDDENLDIEEMMQAMYASKAAAGSACPGPGKWEEEFLKADYSIAFTISASLSGSFSSANVAAHEVMTAHPEKNVYVFDTLSTSGERVLTIEYLNSLIKEGLEFEEIIDKVGEYLLKARLMFALSKFTNLVKTGRMNKVAGLAAELISMRGLGAASREGKIKIIGKARGDNKLIAQIVAEMERTGYENGSVVIGHRNNLRSAETLKAKIEEKWPGSKIRIIELRGLCSFYAEDKGVIIGYYSDNMTVRTDDHRFHLNLKFNINNIFKNYLKKEDKSDKQS